METKIGDGYTGIARLYEVAWNETVSNLPDWKKRIIINNFPYPDSSDLRIADEVSREAVRLAESREGKMLSGVN
jgi:hypothetical protein